MGLSMVDLKLPDSCSFRGLDVTIAAAYPVSNFSSLNKSHHHLATVLMLQIRERFDNWKRSLCEPDNVVDVQVPM